MSNLLSADNLDGRLLFAIPKKGRLYEKCLELLQGGDIQFKRQHRLDVALVQNFPMALVFLPAADIPRFVGEGNVDLGITGQDMVAEAGEKVSGLIEEVMELGFGKCQLQVQIPDPDLPGAGSKPTPRSEQLTAASGSGTSTPRAPIRTQEDLVGLKIATSFDFLAGQHFNRLDAQVSQQRVAEGKRRADEGPLKTTIEYVGGSVEAACALGLADGIVDLVGELPSRLCAQSWSS